MTQAGNSQHDSRIPGAQRTGKPAVSIVMASYGRLQLLVESLASALQQDYPDFEVLIVDDGSDSETRNWLLDAMRRHDRLRVVFQDHQGVAVARERGVEEARGGMVCILDSDDTLDPAALSRLVRAMEENPKRAMVHTNIRELRPNGASKIHRYPSFATSRGMLWATLLSPRVPFKHSGTLFRRDIALRLGSYDRSLPCKIDIDFYLKFLRADLKPHLIEEPLVNFRMHRNSISRDRYLGLRVWFRLIDSYAPPNFAIRCALKGIRMASEMFKWLYMSVVG